MIRASGPRVAGQIYAETDVNFRQRSVTSYVFDPPMRLFSVGENRMDMPWVVPRYCELRGSVVAYDVYDMTHEEHFLNVMDWIEEAKALGVSHRLPRDFPFDVLTSESRLILAHDRAWIRHPGDYYRAWEPNSDRAPRCPFGTPGHEHVPFETATAGAPMCASLWSQDLRGGEIVSGTRLVRRTLGGSDVSYFGFAGVTERPLGEHVDRAFFVGVPIQRLVVVRDPDGRGHELAERLAITAQLPVSLVDPD